jgi:hypothetical protein
MEEQKGDLSSKIDAVVEKLGITQKPKEAVSVTPKPEVAVVEETAPVPFIQDAELSDKHADEIDAALKQFEAEHKIKPTPSVPAPAVHPEKLRKMPDIFKHLVYDVGENQLIYLRYLIQRVVDEHITVERAWEIFSKKYPESWLGKHK